MKEDIFPPYPTFTKNEIERCKKDDDFIPILFEWYKYVGLTCNTVASIDYNSPAIIRISHVHYAVLVGLLNRCSRLMNSTLKLSKEGLFGETISILFRCIAESAIKVQYLCHKNSEEYFERYLSDGLKKDLILKDEVKESISKRGGEILKLDKIVLESIDNCIRSSKLSESKVRDARKFPNLYDICKDLDFSNFFYITIQRMGSHPIHGTWTDLINNYIEIDESGNYLLRDLNVPPSKNHYLVTCYLILHTLEVFIEKISTDKEPNKLFFRLFSEIREQLHEIEKLSDSGNLEVIDPQ